MVIGALPVIATLVWILLILHEGLKGIMIFGTGAYLRKASRNQQRRGKDGNYHCEPNQ